MTEEVWNFKQAPWRHHPKLLLQLHLQLEDGREELICSDTSWLTTKSPVVFDALRNGEFYDASLELPGWDAPGFDGQGWVRARITRAPGGLLRSAQLPPIRVTGTIRPVAIREVQPGVWVYDIGQNLSGWARIRVSGPRGTAVKLRYAEKLNPDGSLDSSNIDVFTKNGEFQTDKFILKGEGE